MTNSARGSTSSRDPSMRVEQSSEQILPSKGRKLTAFLEMVNRGNCRDRILHLAQENERLRAALAASKSGESV